MKLAKQINCTIVGTRTDTPKLVIDNGHVYFAEIESPTRVIFQLLDSEPPWGYVITAGGKTYRDDHSVVPEHPGAYEGPVLTYAPARLPAIHVDGPDFRDEHNQRWIFQMLDGFCDYQVLRDQGADALRPVLQEAKDLGANGRRVFLSGSKSQNTLWEIVPSPTPEFLDRVGVLLDLYTEYGLYAELTHGDLQVVCSSEDAQARYFSALYEYVRLRTNRFVEGANEHEKNGLIRRALDRVNRRGVLSCVGSGLSGGQCPTPAYDYSAFHGTRSFPSVYLDQCPIYIQVGYQGYVGVGLEPVVINEMVGAADAQREWSRCNEPRVFFRLGRTSSAWNGCTGHSDLGIRSQLLASSPIQYACMDALLRGTSGRVWNG